MLYSLLIGWLAASRKSSPTCDSGGYSESDIQTKDGEIGGPVPEATGNRVCAGKVWGGRMLDGKACWAEKKEGTGGVE